MIIEELKEFRNEVLSMAVVPPWCENMETLKKWIDGFETCQSRIIAMIDLKIKNVDQQVNPEATRTRTLEELEEEKNTLRNNSERVNTTELSNDEKIGKHFGEYCLIKKARGGIF